METLYRSVVREVEQEGRVVRRRVRERIPDDEAAEILAERSAWKALAPSMAADAEARALVQREREAEIASRLVAERSDLTPEVRAALLRIAGLDTTGMER